MSTLILKGLICDKTREARDEPYLVERADGADSITIWGPHRMNDGEARSLSLSRTFFTDIRIELWEWDRSGPDEAIGDLLLQMRNIPAAGIRETSHSLEGSRARYRLVYEVLTVDPHRDTHALELIAIRCNDAQERTDEPYLIVNGERAWGPVDMRTNDSQAIGIRLPFYAAANVELWESDAARSDRIGDPLIVDHRLMRICEETPDPANHVFVGDRGFPGTATYTLTYCVRRN